MSVGILGLGTKLPAIERMNSDWPEDVVETWRAGLEWSPERAKSALHAVPTEGARRVLRAMEAYASDPFQGSTKRHVLAPGESITDIEESASRQALVEAETDSSEVDFLLGASLNPDYLNAPGVCALHHRLGLRSNCFTITTDAICNSFQMQLALANALVRGGLYRRGLLVQSSAASRTTPWSEPFSVHFGDGAAAVVVGAVDDDFGLLAQEHETDGALNRALVCTVPGGNWWDDGPIVSIPLDRALAGRMFLPLCDIAARLLDSCYEQTGLTARNVDFFAGHQATVWSRQVVQQHVGLDHARTADTYPIAGTLSGANLPFILSEGKRQSLLRDGDLVALFQVGAGASYSASLLRFGGRPVR